MLFDTKTQPAVGYHSWTFSRGESELGTVACVKSFLSALHRDDVTKCFQSVPLDRLVTMDCNLEF